jgi:hypothetical protein
MVTSGPTEKTEMGAFELLKDQLWWLGVSRKTYYKWEQRGLSALLDGLSDQASGRPEKQKNPVEAELERQLTEVKRQNTVLEQKMALKDLVADFQPRSPRLASRISLSRYQSP